MAHDFNSGPLSTADSRKDDVDMRGGLNTRVTRDVCGGQKIPIRIWMQCGGAGLRAVVQNSLAYLTWGTCGVIFNTIALYALSSEM